MSTDLKKTVFITGCSDGGIGSVLALTFHAHGFHVFASARNPSKMSALANLTDVTLLVLDVLDPNQITAAAEAVQRETDGTLDILINNSGRNHFSPVTDIDIIEAKRLYSASKRSLEILTETLRLEMKLLGVKVMSVVTGAVETNGQTYFEDWKLPDHSLFKAIEDIIAALAQGHDGVKRWDWMEYADEVVNAIIQGNESKIWSGEHAAATKARQPQIPENLMGPALSQGCGLEKLAET